MKKLFYVLTAASLMYACGSGESETSTEEEAQDTVIIESSVQESNIVGEEVTYSADGVDMKGYMVYDASITEPKPGILVVHEWWGHNEHSRAKADQLAKMGYVAFALDMYGDGKQAKHPEDAGKFAGMVMSNIDGAKARFDKAYEVLQSNKNVDPEKMGAVGFCFGGSVVLTMADLGADLDAVAVFHSGVKLPVMPGENLKARVLVCNGEADPMITEDQVTAYKNAMDEAGAQYEYISYPNVKHAFTNPGADALGEEFGLPLAYDADADADSWERMTKLFSSTF